MSQSGIPEHSARPLNVTIIGAGISGLTLGIVLRSNGHRVRIYEQSQFARELGAAIHMAPNAYGLMKRMGLDLPATGANEGRMAKLTREVPVGRFNKIWQHKWMMAHRVRVHDALKEKALSPDGISRPCELYLSASVIDADPETATITLQDGTKVTGDVVIGADGVHSKARRKVIEGENAEPFPSGKSAFRFIIERQDALDDPATQGLCEKKGAFTVAVGVDRRIIMYDTVNNTLLNFVCIHPDSESEAGED